MNATIRNEVGTSAEARGPAKVEERPSPSPAAQRALQEAAARRIAVEVASASPEKGGRGGLEPVRYGDWEVKGIASDF